MLQVPSVCYLTFPACDFHSQRYLMVQNGCQSSSFCTHTSGSRTEEEMKEGALFPLKSCFKITTPCFPL